MGRSGSLAVLNPNDFVYDLCDLESAGFSVVANHKVKYMNFPLNFNASMNYTHCYLL